MMFILIKMMLLYGDEVRLWCTIVVYYDDAILMYNCGVRI